MKEKQQTMGLSPAPLAAIYARKSTEQEGTDADAKSVARQVENARAFISSKGWQVCDQHIFIDDAVSGANTPKLVNRKRMLDLIASRHAPFTFVVMRDTSRFSRRDGDEAFGELKSIAKSGVDVWFYQDGSKFQFGTMATNMVGFLQSEVAAEYRRQIAKFTAEALERKALAGHVTGGRVFGYDNERVDNHTERRINEREAASVLRVFQLAAEGAGQKRIARTLNEAGMPWPRSQQDRPGGWAPSSVRAVLRRTLYRGVITYGKTCKRDDGSRSRQVKRDKSQWLTVDAPELRIVSDKLWHDAHQRMDAAQELYLRANDGRVFGRPAISFDSKYLLTGNARCTCGSNFMAHSTSSGKGRKRYYVCTGYHNRGRTACANGLQLWMEQADAAVLEQLRDYILQPAIVEGALADAVTLLRPAASELDAQRAELEQQARAVEGELANLAKAVAAGGQLPTLIALMKDREQQRDQLRQQAATVNQMRDVGQLDVKRIERDLRARVKEWRALLGRQVPVARQIVTKLLDGRLVFTPREDRSYDFSGRVSLGGLLQGTVYREGWRPRRDSNPCFSLERATS
jgi:site-specific DNA recombinase